jgi:GNAT superfamily N-acetyltransferase
MRCDDLVHAPEADSYSLDDDPGRLDVDAVWAFLSRDAYWGRWRSRSDVERQIASAWRVMAAYDADGRLVGYARAVSDGVGIAYLADVFVLPAHRGRGLGTRLVAEMIEHGPGREFRWLLHTADAHGLYQRFGFQEPDHTLLERPRAPARKTVAEP